MVYIPGGHYYWEGGQPNLGVSKNRGFSPKMDGENNGSKPYEQMDDLGVPFSHYFWFNTQGIYHHQLKTPQKASKGQPCRFGPPPHVQNRPLRTTSCPAALVFLVNDVTFKNGPEISNLQKSPTTQKPGISKCT